MGKTGATLNRGKSDQNTETLWEFIHAVEAHWNVDIALDLASEEATKKAPRCITPELDTFQADWAALLGHNVGWLNPEYDPVDRWLEKCVWEVERGARFFTLTRGAVDTNWFWDLIYPNAAIYAVQPRITFVGHTAPYPFPLILSTWGMAFKEKLSAWRWK